MKTSVLRYTIRVIAPLLVLTFACGKFGKNTLTVSGKNFGEEIALQQNLVIQFGEDIVPDSLIDKWLEISYLKITPEVKGKYKWNSRNELVFSPESGFKPSTNYTAEVTDKISSHVPERFKLSDEHVFKFHTPYLTLRSHEIFWAMNTRNQPELRVRMNFNYPVSPETVSRSTKVQVESSEASHKLQTTEPAAAAVIIAITGAQQPDNKPINIKIDAGLTTEGSDYKAEAISFGEIVPDRSDFRILQTETEYDGEQAYVYVYTNQMIGMNADDLKRALIISPQVAYTVELLDYGFLISGNFSTEQSYKLTISKALKGIFGGTLKADAEQQIVFGEVQAGIRFSAKKGIYLTNKGNKNIGVRITNIPQVSVKIFKVYKNNLLSYLRESGAFYQYDYEYDYESDYDSYFYGDFANYGDLIFEKEYATRDLPKVGSEQLISLDIRDDKPFRGIYVVQVQSTQDQWLRANKLVSLSDIGLVAKATGNEVVVMANSIMTAQPAAGVDITLVSTNNQEIATLKTDANGIARFADMKTKAPGFVTAMIFANQGDDFTYMHFKQTQVATARYEVGGMRENSAGLQAFLYGDRDLYRPDETMYLKAIVRDGQWNPAKNLPVKLRVLLPDGKEFISRRGMLNAQGTYETSVQIPASNVTGTYTVELLSGNDVLLQSRNVNVEDFIPDRIKVNTNVDKTVVRTGETVNFSAQAVNLFGPPARNRKYEVEMSLTRKAFTAKQLPDYDFTLSGRTDVYFEQATASGTTNEEGKFFANFRISPAYKNLGVLEGKIYSTVFDESGRAVNRQTKFEVLTQPLMYGIKNFTRYADVRQPVYIPIVAVNHKGEVQSSAKARVVIVRYQWQNALEREEYSQYYRYVSRKKEIVVKDETISLSGTSTTYPFVPMESGEYQIRVAPTGDDMATYAAQDFYAYSFGMATSTSFEINREGLVQIETDKASYQVGEQAKLLFKTPFKGRMWVTIERNEVLDQFFVDTDGRTGSLTLPVKKEYLPNVYVAVTLIKPADDSSIPLTVAHGYRNLTVEDGNTKLDVKITAAAKSRSNTKQEIVVQTNRKQSDIEVTLAVVDEGILLLKNYQSPDPHRFFFQKRALEVNSYDLYPKLFPELKALQRNYGADYYDLGKRLNPLANKRVKPVSFWSGTLRTNGSGEARYTIDIPQFSGELRIMAVAAKDNAFGSASTSMTVADPMVISMALPRFLSPNDEIEVPVMLANTTANNTQAQAKLSTTGAVEIVGESSQSVAVSANGENQAMFRLKAKPQIGESQIKVEVSALGEKFTQTINLGVRPAVSLLKASGSGRVESGKPQQIDLLRDYLAGSVDARLTISRSPVMEFGKELNYLLQYPYGCVEQTISTAFPQLYLAELIPAPKSNLMSVGKSALNVQEAIRRIQTMQLYSGGLAYWPGGAEESWWGSIYALHFLTEARKAGYEVDAKMLTNLTGYVSSKAKKKSMVDYEYYDAANQRKKVKVTPREVPYSLYVMALTGKPDVSTMNYYKNRSNTLSLDSRYLLATAYMLAGDVASYRKLLPTQFSGERAVQAFDGSFHSYLRDQAVVLNALIETDPQNGQIAAMARQLSQQLKQAKYINTQEAAFSLLALGKLARKAGESEATAAITADGKKIADFKGATLTLTSKDVAGKKVQIQAQGGSLYYFWEMEGLNSTGAYPEEDSYLKVRREFYDRNGNRLNTNAFNQNDLVVVKISLQTTNGATVPNVVVSDLIPAGFEIENPRINSLPGMAWTEKATAPQHTDIRDDRIHLFTTAGPGVSEFYYVVRAVTKGTFRMGPVSADAMYNGEYHSYNGGGEITVR
ncbi:alpha-2-macroglobulin family protein [Rhodoflexus caldus]|uniref:alpha-2-macroglobulin family protein n=1 Tax=Rhodoflexus caldus TaxID=2891236 RepID=UPI00202A3D9D|nr:MG2 domain-containing protein [Rhodoflexus caldus]